MARIDLDKTLAGVRSVTERTTTEKTTKKVERKPKKPATTKKTSHAAPATNPTAKKTTTKPKRSGQKAAGGLPQPVAEPKRAKNRNRFTITGVSAPAKRELVRAGLTPEDGGDGIDTTVRIRAMIELWSTSPAVRKQVTARQHHATGGESIGMTASHELMRELRQAHVDDGIPHTRRVRAMIELWRDSESFARRVDALAAQRNWELIRGRWRRSMESLLGEY